MPGDITLLRPGDDVPARLIDTGDGYAERGDLVEIVGETPEHTQVALCSTPGAGVGLLKQPPASYDHPYNEPGQQAGIGTVRLATTPVDWFDVNQNGWDQTASDPSVTIPSPGDLAVAGSGGVVQQYNGETAGPLGRVWATNNRGENYRENKIAVMRHQ